ncbi:MAG: hypothetical protein ACRC33_24320 [Gemmataceae bacterium]
MRFVFNGLAFETPRIIFHLWSPWRCTDLEHRLFKALEALPKADSDPGPDEKRLLVADPRTGQLAMNAISRVIKGWQEEAEAGSERRIWRWLLEGDVDEDGYDHNGEPASVWCFLRVGLERGGPGEPEKGEDIDLDGFGLEITAHGTA